MQTSTTRAETFSDGVMAIMSTIMVLELKLPNFEEKQDIVDIRNHLKHLLPHFIAYAFSFVMIGILWMSHHHLFQLLKKRKTNPDLTGFVLLPRHALSMLE